MNIPKWGRVTAEPHEYLVHLRKGRVVTGGQGASCFKWPGDSVGLVSTVITKLSFRADQVTIEKVGVEVSGLAVYRVADPVLAFRMIETDRQALSDILREMFVGATRRIVANLTLEECLRHRKERVAEALLSEVSPVLAGTGRPDDTTTRGWGVVIDTIEIQDVRILSQEVFERLQAPFREELALKAIQARQAVVDEEARVSLERERASEAARVAIMIAEEDRIQRTRAREEAEMLHRQGVARAGLEAELEREKRKVVAHLERDELALAGERKRTEQEAKLEGLKREARGSLSDAQLRELLLIKTLPEMAKELRGAIGNIQIQTTSGELGAVLERTLEQVGKALRSS